LQALRDLEHLQVGRPGDSDQQVQQGEDLLARLTHLAASDKFPANQALACQKALLELKLCKTEQALATVLQFVTEDEVPAARWAVHLAAHIFWLEGHVDQVHLRSVPLPVHGLFSVLHFLCVHDAGQPTAPITAAWGIDINFHLTSTAYTSCSHGSQNGTGCSSHRCSFIFSSSW